MNRYKFFIKIAAGIILIVILFILYQAQDKKSWFIYFAPSSTDVMYGNDEAYLVKVDSNGKTENYNTKAYPFSGLISFNNEKLIFQTKKGLSVLDDEIETLNKDVKEDTVGYNMAASLGEDKYYFLCNGSFKKDCYSSKLIIGENNNECVHEVKGFVNSYGNDEANIYLLTDDMINKKNKQIQKISVKDTDDVTIKMKNFSFETDDESNFKMIVDNDYIYAFVVEDSKCVKLLRISKDNLEIVETIDFINFDYDKVGDFYYPMCTNSIFKEDNKIYYISMGGKVYSFDINFNEFLEEFTLKDYNMENCLNSLGYFSYEDKTINILYFNQNEMNYYLNLYSVEGKLFNKIKLNLDKVNDSLYPHNFIRVK